MEKKKSVKITKDLPMHKAVELGVCHKECQDCRERCKKGSGAFAPHQLETLSKHLSLSIEELKQHYLEEVERFSTKLHRPKIIREKKNRPYGRCIFYDDKDGCKIHSVKPLECAISTHGDTGKDLHTWFTLNYFVDPEKRNSIRDWAIHLELGGKTINGGHLKDLVKDEKKLKEYLKDE